MLRREEKGVGVHSSAIPPSLLSTVVCKLLAGGNKSWQAGRGEGQNGWWLSDPFPLPYSLIGTIKKTCKLCCLPPLFALSKTSIFIVPPATELLKGGPAATVTDRPPRTVQNSYAPRSLRSVARSAFSSTQEANDDNDSLAFRKSLSVLIVRLSYQVGQNKRCPELSARESCSLFACLPMRLRGLHTGVGVGGAEPIK